MLYSLVLGAPSTSLVKHGVLLKSIVVNQLGSKSLDNINKKRPYLFVIKNNSDNNIARVIVLDKTNKTLYNNIFSCSMDAKCELEIKKQEIKWPLTFKFINKDNKLVSAYTLMMSYNAYSYININDNSLGDYLFKKLKRDNQISADILNQRLNEFFLGYSSPDGLPDIYEELGLYFKAQVVNGTNSEEQFLNDLFKKLERGTILNPSKKFDKTQRIDSLINIANSRFKTNSCPANSNDLLQYMSTVSEELPFIGTIINLSKDIFTDTCSNFENQTLDKLNEILSKLNEMDSKLDNLDFNLDKLSEDISKSDANNIIVRIHNSYNKLGVITNKYQSLLAAIPEYGIESSPSLNDLVHELGGLNKQTYNDYGDIRDLLTQVGEQQNLYKELSSKDDLMQLSNSLANICADHNKITGDVVSARNKCNFIISNMIAQISYSQQVTSIMLKDEINTIDTAFREAKGNRAQLLWLKGNFADPFFGAKSWPDAKPKVDQLMKDSLENLSLAFNNRMYIPLNGLDQSLQDNIIEAGCDIMVNRKKYPEILNWYAHGNSNEKYIVTKCSVSASNAQESNVSAISRYYYMDEKNNTISNITNVLGVVVPTSALVEVYKYSKAKRIFAKDFYAQISSGGCDEKYICRNKVEFLAGKTQIYNGQILESWANNRILPKNNFEEPIPGYPMSYFMKYDGITNYPNESNSYDKYSTALNTSGAPVRLGFMSYTYDGMTYVFTTVFEFNYDPFRYHLLQEQGYRCLTSDCKLGDSDSGFVLEFRDDLRFYSSSYPLGLTPKK